MAETLAEGASKSKRNSRLRFLNPQEAVMPWETVARQAALTKSTAGP